MEADRELEMDEFVKPDVLKSWKHLSETPKIGVERELYIK